MPQNTKAATDSSQPDTTLGSEALEGPPSRQSFHRLRLRHLLVGARAARDDSGPPRACQGFGQAVLDERRNRPFFD
jgi:hypothetical protein